MRHANATTAIKVSISGSHNGVAGPFLIYGNIKWITQMIGIVTDAHSAGQSCQTILPVDAFILLSDEVTKTSR
jgi:hypothetical protein